VESWNRDKGEVYAKEGEDVSIIKRGERRSIRVY